MPTNHLSYCSTVSSQKHSLLTSYRGRVAAFWVGKQARNHWCDAPEQRENSSLRNINNLLYITVLSLCLINISSLLLMAAINKTSYQSYLS